MLKLENIAKVYKTKSKTDVHALKNINLDFARKGLVFILGQSGSGKTTLLNILGGLDSQTTGKVVVENNLELGKDVSLEAYRKNYVSFVFQEYNLLEELNVFDNVSLSVTYSNKDERTNAVKNVLKNVALDDHEKRRISELSGGQKQRVAIARALAQDSKILLCDEPTGNLDSATGKEIFDLLKEISADKLVIVVSHNEEMAANYADRIIKIKDGEIESDNVTDKEIVSDEVSTQKAANKNGVSLLYKLKCGAVNLFVRKFKTGIAFLLLFLSLFATCLMQVCLSYNSQHSIAKSLSDDSSIVVIKNSSNFDDSVMTGSESYTIGNELKSHINSADIVDGYRTSYGTVFILDDTNAEIVDSKEFCFKNDLSQGYAYVTDYFVDIIVNLSNDYNSLKYDEIAELADAEVVYQGNKLFKIAGVIKTDYKTLYDERGNEFFVPTGLDEKNKYQTNLNYKTKYHYRAIYALDETFEQMYVSVDGKYYSDSDGFTITVSENTGSINLKSVDIYNIKDRNSLFYTSSGYYGTYSGKPDANTLIVELAEDEIVINGSLYERIFDFNESWEEFNRLYSLALMQGEPMENALEHLNETISISIQNADGTILNIDNKKIVGVTTDVVIGKEMFCVYGTKEGLGLTNKDFCGHYVSELNWHNISNKYKTLELLRNDSVVVAGVQASLIYEKEYMVLQMSYFFIGIAAVILLISVIAILNLVNSKINDKKKEIGILLSIGLKKSEINFIYMFSVLIMVLLAAVLTIGLMYLSVFIVNSILTMSVYGFIYYFNVTWITYAAIFATSLTTLLLSMCPLAVFTKQKPVDIIRNQI